MHKDEDFYIFQLITILVCHSVLKYPVRSDKDGHHFRRNPLYFLTTHIGQETALSTECSDYVSMTSVSFQCSTLLALMLNLLLITQAPTPRAKSSLIPKARARSGTRSEKELFVVNLSGLGGKR